MIPDYVAAALVAWHRTAVEYDPEHPTHEVSERAKAAWVEFKNQCLRWEHEGRITRARRVIRGMH